MMMTSRRMFAQMGLAAAASACASQQGVGGGDGWLMARPGVASAPSERRGAFSLSEWPRPLVFAPEGIDAGKPAPMILLLHGAGQQAEAIMKRMTPAAEARGVIILAPQAERSTWDVIRSFGDGGEPRFGEDTRRVDAALSALFAQFTIDPKRVAIAGFSDGASYALSLGPRNQEVFTHIMGFSPGGVAPFEDGAKAKVFISHGRQDPVLAFANTAEGIVPGFKARGFDVRFEMFDGVHAFRDAEIGKAMDWFLA